jgi:glycosyltransferase involved in cell wall biosynthesis
MTSNEIKLSVALCTYNGERYLYDQLVSIANQSRKPDELVIFDDCSTDNTNQILDKFAQNCDFPVRIHSQVCNVGSTQNFSDAIEACRGDIIALADQDDVWNHDKLESLERTLNDHPEAVMAYSDADMVDENLQPLGYRLWEAVGLTKRDRQVLGSFSGTDVLIRKFAVTGMTIAFRRVHVPLVTPIDSSWIHDGWIAFSLASIGPLVGVEKALVSYRQHTAQQVGEKKRSLYQNYLRAKAVGRKHLFAHREMYSAIRNHLDRQQRQWPIDKSLIVRLDEKIRHLQNRIWLRENRLRKIYGFVVWISGGYQRFSFGWKSLLQDLLC